MSIEEKIETLQSIMNDACTLCNDYFGPDLDCDEHCIRINTINEASAALRKADKYKWHDLRKNPDDLPPCEVEVEIAYERYDGAYGSARAIYEDGTMHSEESIFCFDELDEWCEYCEETDDYIIPSGWLEVVKFAESMGFIDRPIIAWREIDPFEVEE